MKTLAVALLLMTAPALAGDAAIGDSIALGAGQALGVPTIARVGASSCSIIGFVPVGPLDRVVISAGVNDPPGRCVPAIRARLAARRVVWIRPVNSASLMVEATAAAYGDRVISYVVGFDHLHPASYAALARSVRAAWQ